MQKKKILIFTAILSIGIFSFYVFKNYAKKVKDEHCLVTQISSKIFDFNTFELKLDSTLNLSDFKIVNQNNGTTIFVNGKSKKGIDIDYGYRIFELYYKEKKQYEFIHFSKNNWYVFDYTLTLTKSNNRIQTDLKIEWNNDACCKDLCYKRYEYNENGKLDRIDYLNLSKEVYNVEEVKK